MKNRNPDIVIITDDKDLKFECKICGEVWKPTILTGGRLAWEAWQCPQGCKRVGPVVISYL